MEAQTLETMLQKFSAGDRSLEVLAALNEAAWEGFHDPWERKPFFLTEDAETFLGGGMPGSEAELLEDLGAPVEQPRNQGKPGSPSSPPSGTRKSGPGTLPPCLAEKVAAYLEVHHWDYGIDESGGFRCTPPLHGMDGQDLTLRLSGGRGRSRCLWLHLTSGWEVPAQALGTFRGLCDQWNSSGRNLRSRLAARPPSTVQGGPPIGTLSLHAALEVPPDADLRTIVAFLDECLEQAGDFWARARKRRMV